MWQEKALHGPTLIRSGAASAPSIRRSKELGSRARSGRLNGVFGDPVRVLDCHPPPPATPAL